MRGWYAEQPLREYLREYLLKACLFNDTVDNPDRIILGNKIA